MIEPYYPLDGINKTFDVIATKVQKFHFEKILIYLTRLEMLFLEKIFCESA